MMSLINGCTQYTLKLIRSVSKGSGKRLTCGGVDKYTVCRLQVDRWQETSTDEAPISTQQLFNALDDGEKAVCKITEPIEIQKDYLSDIL